MGAFAEALFATVKTWKQPPYPSTNIIKTKIWHEHMGGVILGRSKGTHYVCMNQP